MLNFEEIKKIRLTDVLGRYGIRLRFKGDWANAPCPLPTHKEGDKGRTFTINLPQNYWRCFSESCNEKNAGRKGGDVINFVALMENCREKQAAENLAGWYGINGNGSAQKAAPRMERRRPEEPPKEPSQKDSPEHNSPSDSVKPRYMQEIDTWFDELFGLNPETARDEYWQTARNGVKAKLIESYKNGKLARAS